MSAREELRRRFVKAETTLFRVRYDSDDTSEKEEFLNSRDFDWITVRLSHLYLEVVKSHCPLGRRRGEASVQ